MRTKIIHKFRVVECIAYKPDYSESHYFPGGYTYKMKRDHFGDCYRLQQKRRFWFGYKTLEKAKFEDTLREKMEILKEIYGEYS